MGRGRAPCCEREGLRRGWWTAEEDEKLVSFIKKHGHENWRTLPKRAGLLRCGKSCRLRWVNYLRPGIKHGNYSQEEEDTIIQLHRMLGNQWAKIASFLPGRTDNEIKNIWNTYLGKRFTAKNGSLAFQKTFSYSAAIAASIPGEERCSIDGDAPNPDRIETETSIDMLSNLGTPDMQPLQPDSSQAQFHYMISSSTLSAPPYAVASTAEDANAQWGERASAIDEIDIDSAIDPDFWNDTINSFTAPAAVSDTSQEGKVPIDFDESERWMVELVEELGLFEEVHGTEDEIVIERGRAREIVIQFVDEILHHSALQVVPSPGNLEYIHSLLPL